jgi:hypothetical protein
MKKFILRIGIFIIASFLVLEIFSRIFIDPIYFATINTYNIKVEGFSKLFGTKPTPKVDYLFIGNSKVPATINPKIFAGSNNDKIAVVAGRGSMTAGIHYQALSHRLKNYPEYLKDAYVFIEYPDPLVFTNLFIDDEFMVMEHNNGKSRAHLLLPHLDWPSLLAYLNKSKNSNSTKIEMIPLFLSSAYRTSFFLNEQWAKRNQPFVAKPTSLLAIEGGIRNDNIEFAKKMAEEMAEQASENLTNSAMLTFESLNQSSLNKIATLIKENGGKLYMYEMPMHSLQNKFLYNPNLSEYKKVFEKWLEMKGIAVISCTDIDFKYSDEDFPDAWHLGINRRDEFSSLLYTTLNAMEKSYTEEQYLENEKITHF